MTTNDQPQEPSLHPVSRAVGQIEAFCGVVVAGLAFLTVLGASLLGFMMPWIAPGSHPFRSQWVWIACLLGLVAGAAEVLGFIFIFRTIQRARGKKLLALAERHPIFPIPLRPIVFLWWATHFALIALAGHYATPMIRIVDNPTDCQRWGAYVIQFLFAVGVSFSSNSYLMLMAASLTHRRSVLLLVFRLRILVDAMLVSDLLLPHRWF